MNIAKVTNNTIENVIVADSVQWAIDNLGGEWIEQPEGVGLGWTLEGDTWVAPPAVEPELPPVTQISKLAFRNRFTQAEKEAIYTAAESSVSVKIWLDDLNAASYVDLTDQQTIDGVNSLEAAGLIGAGRVSEILATT